MAAGVADGAIAAAAVWKERRLLQPAGERRLEGGADLEGDRTLPLLFPRLRQDWR